MSHDLDRSLALLDNDLEALGWDQPARLYGLKGSVDDPELELLGSLPGHPFDTLEQVRRSGLRTPDDYIGLAVATEAWIPITLDVAIERMLAPAPPDGVEVTSAHRSAWLQALMATSESISTLPEDYRREVRVVTAITRDGSVHMYTKFRDDGSTDVQHNATASGRMVNVMQDLLGIKRTVSPEL